MTAPDADLSANFTYYNSWMIQNGETDFKKPIGTGPFMADTFTPGKESVFQANPNYWVTGKPYVKTLKIISFDDTTARLNALLSGEIQAMAQLPTADAKAHSTTGDITVLSGPSPQPMMFYMDVTQAPFNDLKVRQAMRLIADRQALIDGALNGYGTVGNDVVGKGAKYYDASLPQRVQDIEQAKSLLKSAGQSNLTVELDTSPIFPGFVESATLLAQQAKDAGVTINLKQQPSNSYYDPSTLYLKMAFAETQWAITSLKFFYEQALASGAPYPETHWKNSDTDKWLNAAIAESDQAKAQGYWNQVQKQQYDEGGYLQWVNADWVDGLAEQRQGHEAERRRCAWQHDLHERMASVLDSGTPHMTAVAERGARSREVSPVLKFVGRRLLGADRGAVRGLDRDLRRHRDPARRCRQRGAGPKRHA